MSTATTLGFSSATKNKAASNVGPVDETDLVVKMCVHDLVTERAIATPSAVALVAGEGKLTYGELEARSNQLANLLRANGVGPEVPVALCMTRSADFIVTALAILKAGGAYVPIDPAYPRNRVSMLLEDSGAPLLLTQACLAAQMPSGSWRTLIVNSTLLEGQPQVAPQCETKPENLAYIIFTSGSTGRPKGVQITHSNLLNLISWHRRAFQVEPTDRATLHASPGFDAAVWELWPYLASGSSLYVVDEDVRTAAQPLRDWLLQKQITISFLPTAMAGLLIDLPWPAETALRVLLTGADTLRRYPRAGLPFALVNNYGPTECTVVATSAVVPAGVERNQELPPIGRPIDNVQTFIVDEQLQLVQEGVAGELVIAGAGVGRGYVNLAESTAEKFVRNPFSTEPGARLYRTGDLARALPDGQIAFLGRMDEQIKIRGFRIEPQEISSALEFHPAIRSSFVSSYRNGSEEMRLVAYLVSAGATPNPSDLRAFLGQDLPDYMIPSVFVCVEELPFTANGKVDRAALPAPTNENILVDPSFEVPESPVEERVGEIVANLLGVSHVGRRDNFFNLGGHSLMGAQIIAKVRDVFGVDLSLRSLFDEPTVAGISLAIEELIHAKLAAMSEEEVERLLASGM
ncbi:MAG TPA: non-ribosomal peptide synthetase [Terriglobales bacterium]